MYRDSKGFTITIGDKVKFRNVEYTIRMFRPMLGQLGTAAIEFEEVQHVEEVADEISVDRVSPIAWRNGL